MNLVSPCGWNSEFATRQDLDYNTENTPYVEWSTVLHQSDPSDPSNDEGVVRNFMSAHDESDVCTPQADKVEAFCAGTSLQSLRTEKWKGNKPLPRVALLDERSFKDGAWRSRPYRGPLTALGLYHELKKPRFRVSRSNQAIGIGSPSDSGRRSLAETSGNPGSSDADRSQEDLEPDAERRLIFIADPDPLSFLALIGTASCHQAPILRDTLYRHVAFETFMGVTVAPEGLPMFHMAFHLPYYVWRPSQKSLPDHRRNVNEVPLRHSQDVSFLTLGTDETPGFLHEAQISCAVAGSDNWRWVAYCFVEAYFDLVDEGKETALEYHDDSLHGMRSDPFTYGVTNMDDSSPNPREYFLKAFRYRLNQVRREWQQVVDKLDQSIRRHEQMHNDELPLLKDDSPKQKAEAQDTSARKWVIEARKLSGELSRKLSETVKACDTFCYRYAVNFQDLSADRCRSFSSLSAIQTTFYELESLKNKLESMAMRCDDFERNLKVLLNLEQHKLAQQNKTLSVILMLSFPITLTSTIFSTRENIIPFIPANFVSFVIMSLVFGGLGVSIYAFQEDQHWNWQVLVEAARQVFWAAKMEEGRLKTLPLHKEESVGPLRSRIWQGVEDRASQVWPISLSSCDHRARLDLEERRSQDQAPLSSACNPVQQLSELRPAYSPCRVRTMGSPTSRIRQDVEDRASQVWPIPLSSCDHRARPDFEERRGQDQVPPSSACNPVQQLSEPRPAYSPRRTRTNGLEQDSE